MHSHSLPPSDRDDAADKPIAPAESKTAADRRRGVDGDVVNRATENLPDHQRSVIRAYHAFITRQNMTLDEAAKLLKDRDGSTLSSVFRNNYGAGLDRIVEDMKHVIDLEDARSKGRKAEFIETSLSQTIWGLCDQALEFQLICILIGDGQVGKTEALTQYQQNHNHGRTIYVRMPASGAISDFTTKMAKILRIPERCGGSQLRRRIIDAFDSRMLLIVDEVSCCVGLGDRNYRRIQTIEYIREIFDDSKCGLVLCATKTFHDVMEKGSLAKFFEQLGRRRLCTHVIDNRPTPEDLNTFANAFGLEPASGTALKTQTAVIEEHALGRWLTVLRSASKIAAKAKKKTTWTHVIEAHHTLEAIEGKLR